MILSTFLRLIRLTEDCKKNEWLNMHIFDSIAHVQSLATQWMWIYNNERPHSSIGKIPPRKLLEAL